MATFHPFPRLPAELRVQIWAMTVIPRTVEVRIAHRGSARMPYLVSPTPVPAILQTCREARYQGLYQQAFSELAAPEPRYVWLDFEIDIVSIGTTELEDFTPVASLIRRLKLERKISEENFFGWGGERLTDFVNAKEIHVVCADGLRNWHGAAQDYYWPCNRENLFFINPEDGSTMRSIEMDAMLDELEVEEFRQADELTAASWAQYGYHYPSGERMS